VLIMGVIGGENPSFPNKVIIRISGVLSCVFGWCLTTLICDPYLFVHYSPPENASSSITLKSEVSILNMQLPVL